MGQIIQTRERFEYQQENGQVTAVFPDITEKTELSHIGDPASKKIFYLLISAGILYLVLVFALVH